MDGYYGKITMREFSLIDFPLDLGGKFLWARERKVSPGFSTPLIFSPLPNSGKLSFPPYFPSYVFGWNGGKVGGWKTFLFGWREKWKDGKYNLYKLTIIPLLLHNR